MNRRHGIVRIDGIDVGILSETEDGYVFAYNSIWLGTPTDLVSTSLVIADDPLALPIGGRNKNLQRSTWLKFAKYCGIGEKAASRVLDRQASVLNQLA